MKLLFAATVCIAATCCAQSIQPTFQNLNFGDGKPGKAPPGWVLGQDGSGYRAETDLGVPCEATRQCASLSSIGEGAPAKLAFLHQIVDAKPYRGKTLMVSAGARADVPQGGEARLLVRIHRDDGSTSFRNTVAAARQNVWWVYEMQVPVASAARDIEFGMQLEGHGVVWIDNVQVNLDSAGTSARESAVRALIQKFADARNAKDGKAAADTYAEDGEYISGAGGFSTHGRIALAALWEGVDGQARRTIHSVKFITLNLAVVRVVAQVAPGSSARAHDRFGETFVVGEDAGQWKIRVHQAER